MRAIALLLAAGFLLVSAFAAAQKTPAESLPTPEGRGPGPWAIDVGKTTGAFAGNATWPDGPEARILRAPAEWVVVEDRLLSYRFVMDNATYGCAQTHAVVLHADGTTETGTCSGLATAAGVRMDLVIERANGTGTAYARSGELIADPHRSLLLAATDADAPAAWPGYVLMTVTGILVAAIGLLSWYYIRERRIARYLVRRLFEETKGTVPADWPPELRKQTIARFIARGKN